MRVRCKECGQIVKTADPTTHRCNRCTKCGQHRRDDSHKCQRPGPRPRDDALSKTKAYKAAKQRMWRATHPGYERRYYDDRRAYRITARIAALVAYGGDPPTCVCCSENEEAFLVLDHVNGGGNQERKAQGHRGGIQAYTRLRREGWPTGYQVLCWNCNAARSLRGRCPHQE